MEKAATAEAGEVRRRCAGHERSRSASATVPLSRMSGAAFWLFIFLGSDNLSQAADRNRFLIHSAPHPLRECGAPVGTTMHGEDKCPAGYDCRDPSLAGLRFAARASSA